MELFIRSIESTDKQKMHLSVDHFMEHIDLEELEEKIFQYLDSSNKRRYYWIAEVYKRMAGEIINIITDQQ